MCVISSINCVMVKKLKHSSFNFNAVVNTKRKAPTLSSNNMYKTKFQNISFKRKKGATGSINLGRYDSASAG